MTVADLIAELRKMPPSLEVWHEYDALWRPAGVRLVTRDDPQHPRGEPDWRDHSTPSNTFVLLS